MFDLVCCGPHIGGRPVLGSTDIDPGPGPSGLLCEDCGLVYTFAQQLVVTYPQLSQFMVGMGSIPSVDVACALIYGLRPAGYVPRYPPGKASWAPNANWPPPIPNQFKPYIDALPKTPRQGPQ